MEIDELIAQGADVDATDFKGRTPLHRAVVNVDPAAVVALLGK